LIPNPSFPRPNSSVVKLNVVLPAACKATRIDLPCPSHLTRLPTSNAIIVARYLKNSVVPASVGIVQALGVSNLAFARTFRLPSGLGPAGASQPLSSRITSFPSAARKLVFANSRLDYLSCPVLTPTAVRKVGPVYPRER
jgi:hypothetical protein